MDGDPTNKERVDSAFYAMLNSAKYIHADEDDVVNLIADLLHYAKNKGMNPNILDLAKQHFAAEVLEGS